MKKISCKKFQKEMTMKATDEKDVKHTCCFCSADCLYIGSVNTISFIITVV